MAYFNEKRNYMLHKRQGANSNNKQPFPDSPPSPNNNSSLPANSTNNSGIGKFSIIGIVVGVVIVLFVLIGIFLRKKLVRERMRNAIRINDVEWNNNSSEKTSRTIRPLQQSRDVYNNEQDIGGEKGLPSMMIKNINSPQFSNFNSPRVLSPIESEFQKNNSNLKYPPNSYQNDQYSPKQRRFQPHIKGQYQHLPRSPRSPLVFKNRTLASDSDDDDDDTLRGTPRSPYFFKDENVPKNTNDQDLDDIYKAVPLTPQTINNDYEGNYNDKRDNNNDERDNNNYNNNNNNNGNNGNNGNKNIKIGNGDTRYMSSCSIKKRNEIISQLDTDLNNIISNFNNFENINNNNNYLDQQYKQNTNDLQPSSVNLLKSNNDTLALSLPSPFKLSWTKDSSYDNLLAPITSTNEESNKQNSQPTNSIYSDSESRTNSLKGMNQNVQMDYIQPTQGMIQIEMMEDHIITKNEMPKESIKINEPRQESDVEYVDNKSHIVAPSDISNIQPRTIQPIETNMKTEQVRPEINAPVIKETTRPEILSSKPIVTPGFKPISPMYDIEAIKRHAEKVLNKKTANKEVEVNEIKKNDKNDKNESSNEETQEKPLVRTKNESSNEETEEKPLVRTKNESSNEETEEKPLVRKKSVRFQAEHANEETSGASNFATRKSILINKNDIINIQDNTTQQSSTPESDDEEENHRNSTSSYQMYDFDISSYQDNTNSIYFKH